MRKDTWEHSLNRWGKPDFGSLNSFLDRQGIAMQLVGNGYGKFDTNIRKVTLMTYHSSKGLDFDYVYIPFANYKLFISPDEDRAKTIFMVALTRSKDNLL